MAMNEVMQPSMLASDVAAAGEDVPPLSRMAVLALILGIVSLFAIFSTVLLPLCIIAIGLSATILWKISRDPSVRGSGLAQVGLALAVASTFWSVTAANGHKRYLYGVAAQHAKEFLDVLSAGNKYQALELMLPELNRQVTGTDLEKYYANADPETKDRAESFFRDAVTQFVMAQGPEAEWEFVRGIQIQEYQSSAGVIVEMRNKNASGSKDRVWVLMERKLGQIFGDKDEPTALWNVGRLTFPES